MDVLTALLELLRQLLVFTADIFFVPVFAIGFFLICFALVGRLFKGV